MIQIGSEFGPVCGEPHHFRFASGNLRLELALLRAVGSVENIPTDVFHFSQRVAVQRERVCHEVETLALSIVLKPRGRDVPSELSSLASHESIHG